MGIPNQPLVTVYIPTYNRINLLKRAVKSVQDQTYKNLEIIIVDDCSTDGTPEYLVHLAQEDTRVRYFLKETNSGACMSRNIAIENAKGEFITGLDDDDMFEKKRIEKFIQFTEKYNMDEVILYSLAEVLNKENNIKKIFKKYLTKKYILQKDLLNNNYIGNQIFCKTSCFRNIGGFDSSFKMWQDLECWYRLLENKYAICIKEYTYILDLSHDYTRISKANYEKLNDTYNLFCEKHKLKISERKLLKTHFLNYSYYDFSIFYFFKRLFLSKNLWDFTLLIKFLLRK